MVVPKSGSGAPDPIRMTPLEFTEFAIQHRGEAIDLGRRPWLWGIYNMVVLQNADGTFRRKMLLVFGRQCEKSTTIANIFIALANIFPYLRELYVTASDIQMREFSDERLRAVISDSPKLLELSGQAAKTSTRSRLKKREVQNVQTKRWTSKSKLTLRSAYRQGADRVRGIASDVLGVDELQDIYVDNLPVIEETLFHSELEGGPISIYSGTPKTFDNPLELYWSKYSTQNEWMVQCDECKLWNVIETDNIGEEGLECKDCRFELDPVDGNAQWVRFGRADAEWEGFRVPQPVVIYASKRDKPAVFKRQWAELLNKLRRYPRPKFQNEVMARSYDAGSKPVTFEEVRRCCINDYDFMRDEDITTEFRDSYKWAGVDWGVGTGSGYTMLSIWNYDHQNRFRLLYAKKYEGLEADPDLSVQDIIDTLRKYKVQRIGSDWGFGFHANPKLLKEFGADRVILYQHGGRQAAKISWDKTRMVFMTHRTRVLQDCFALIKKGPVAGGVAFVAWPPFEPFANDIFSVYQEFSERSTELIYDHPSGVPDDFLHTFCYAFLVSQLDVPRPDIQAPSPARR